MSKPPNLDGYVDVAQRLAMFYGRYPDGSLQPLDPHQPYRLEQLGDTTYLVYTAAAFRHPDDPRPGVGVAWEQVPGRTPYTRGSELMNAETSSWGRAIGSLGIGSTDRIATADEVTQARARQEPTPKAPRQDPAPPAQKPQERPSRQPKADTPAPDPDATWRAYADAMGVRPIAVLKHLVQTWTGDPDRRPSTLADLDQRPDLADATRAAIDAQATPAQAHKEHA